MGLAEFLWGLGPLFHLPGGPKGITHDTILEILKEAVDNPLGL